MSDIDNRNYRTWWTYVGHTLYQVWDRTDTDFGIISSAAQVITWSIRSSHVLIRDTTVETESCNKILDSFGCWLGSVSLHDMFAKKEPKNTADIDPQIAEDELAIWDEEVEEDERELLSQKRLENFWGAGKRSWYRIKHDFFIFPHWNEIQTTRRNAH